MVWPFWRICSLVLGFLFQLPICQAIACFDCSSINGSDPLCQDPFSPPTGLFYKPQCFQTKSRHSGKFPAKYCTKIKGVNMRTQEEMLVRSCDLEDNFGNMCGIFMFEHDSYKGCVMSCKTPGCNTAHRASVPAGLSLFLLPLFGLFAVSALLPPRSSPLAGLHPGSAPTLLRHFLSSFATSGSRWASGFPSLVASWRLSFAAKMYSPSPHMLSVCCLSFLNLASAVWLYRALPECQLTPSFCIYLFGCSFFSCLVHSAPVCFRRWFCSCDTRKPSVLFLSRVEAFLPATSFATVLAVACISGWFPGVHFLPFPCLALNLVLAALSSLAVSSWRTASIQAAIASPTSSDSFLQSR